MTILYVRATTHIESAIDTQVSMAQKYCQQNGLKIDETFYDKGKTQQRRKLEALLLESIGYHESYKNEKYYPEFDNMMLLIAEGKVSTILVDIKQRLRIRPHTDEFFMKLCNQHGVEIIEYGSFQPDNDPTTNRVIIYHNTNGSNERVQYILTDIDNMYYTVHCNGWTVYGIYIDETRVEQSRKKFLWLMEHLQPGDIFVVKSLLNISTKMNLATKILEKFHNSNIRLFTLSLGDISIISNKDNLNRDLKVIVYDSFTRSQDEFEIIKERMKLFITLKTKWIVNSYFYEGHRAKTVDEYNVLDEILQNQSSDYDVILVSSFKRLNRNTCRFENIIRQIEKERIIYSLEEGGFLFGKK